VVTVRPDHNAWQANAQPRRTNFEPSVKPQVSALVTDIEDARRRRVGAHNSPDLVPDQAASATMTSVSTGGKRAASRRAAPAPRTLNKAALGLGVAITLCVVAWGYLVYAAIDFGTAARSGSDGSAWSFMALACLGAIACLFVGLLLVARLMRALGITQPPPSDDAPPRPVGGKRAAR
jgi:hypothetical protein